MQGEPTLIEGHLRILIGQEVMLCCYQHFGFFYVQMQCTVGDKTKSTLKKVVPTLNEDQFRIITVGRPNLQKWA